MKKKLAFILLALLMVFMLYAAAESKYYIDREKMTVNIGYAVTLHIKEQGTGEQVSAEWESSNPYVAWVDSDGAVHAECAGDVVITGRTKDGTELKCKVNVPGNVIKYIKFPAESVTLGTNETKSFAAEINQKADQKTIEYVSYDESVVTVDSKGKLSGVGKGTATIRATAANGLTAYAEVTVYISLEDIELDAQKLVISIDGQPQQVNCILTPANTDQNAYTWSISDESIATVADGLVTPVSIGATTLTCKSETGKSVSIPVTVGILAERVEVTGGGSVVCFESTRVSAKVYPENATDTSFTWVVEDPKVACVTRAGVLWGLSAGETMVYAVANGGLDVQAEMHITVTENPSITPKKVTLTFDDGPAQNTLKLLDVLADYNAKATFFVVGENVKKRPEIVLAEYRAGHEIGNHTWSHQVLVKIGVSEGKEEIGKCDEAVKAITGEAPKFIRAPGGDITDKRISWLMTDRYYIYWTLDTRDWESRNSDSVYRNVINMIKDQDVLLFHDLYASTTTAVERLLPELISRGYTFISLSEMLELNPPSADTYLYLGGG